MDSSASPCIEDKSSLEASSKSPLDSDCTAEKIESSKIVSPRISQTSLSNPSSYSSSLQGSTVALSRYRAPSVLGITALLHDHAEFSNKEIFRSSILDSSVSASSPHILLKPVECNNSSVSKVSPPPPPPPPTPPPPPPPPPTTTTTVPPPPPTTTTRTPPPPPTTRTPPPPPPPPPPTATTTTTRTPPPPPTTTIRTPPPPPPPPSPPPPPPPTTTTPPPPPPQLVGSAKASTTRCAAPPPLCPPSFVKKESSILHGLSKSNSPSLQLHSSISTTLCAKGNLQLRTSTRTQSQSKKTSLKPYHWLKLTRAMQGSLWAEAQKPEEVSKAPELDMFELESLFSATVYNSDQGGNIGITNRRGSGIKPDKVHLIELRRAYNCEIMLTKVKVPLSDLMSSVLALDDSALDIDQVDNLIKFCPTKEEILLLKNYKGDKENLGKCEQFFMELMKVPRVESKLRVFSFKIQFFSQMSDLGSSLKIVNSASDEVRNSVKLKRIMQTILSLGNALNHGTARGSAVGFRLDSLLKLTETRARNNKMTLMHYLCKVLTAKLPEVLDFHEDLVSLEAATKIQLKYLAEEMQAISKGLEKVKQELTASENDGDVSEYFCKTLKDFFVSAELEVRSLASLYSGVGRNADALAIYFGEDPARCTFEQVVSNLLNFVRMFRRAHEENCKQLELEKRKAQKEVENWKTKAYDIKCEKDVANTISRVKSKSEQIFSRCSPF